MKTIKYLFAVLLLIFLCSWNTTNHTPIKVIGIVTDAQNGSPLQGVGILIGGSQQNTKTNRHGQYEIEVPSERTVLIFSLAGYASEAVKVEQKKMINVSLHPAPVEFEEVMNQTYSVAEKKVVAGRFAHVPSSMSIRYEREIYPSPYHTEEYEAIHENSFLEVLKNPLSTFSIDVDNASYSNVRRFINNGQTPPVDAVRIEEMINYFTYDYPQPKGDAPFAVQAEISDCPWNKGHKLIHIGLQGKKIATEDLPASNLVFLIDVSGSMQSPQKLPLLKSAFQLLTNALREQDHVAMVVYAGAAGVVLPSTSGTEKATIRTAIERLDAGGSTAGGAGIKLAYQIAEENFIKGGNNRVILATDGDFNVGASSNAAMERLIEEKRASGVALTVLGFGMGNYKDSKMEALADKGNGNYAYIDNMLEAKKVLVSEFGGTLFTIAKDVKLQIEFNPAKVKGYRLIGYENRALKNEDFNNDEKDAGDLGAGHTVTALYEIIPADAEGTGLLKEVDNLKYQKSEVSEKAYQSEEVLTLKLRYKDPDGEKSKLITKVVQDEHTPFDRASDNFRFSAAVAAYGMLLRDSEFKGDVTFSTVLTMAEEAKGRDEEGYRAEFLNLVRTSQLMAKR